ncbi:MAG: alpha-L-fucosidase [Oscillospiraceae bacterium]
MDRLDLYTSIVPSERQIEVQRDGFNVFIHYGLNTFTGKEWGDGKVPASMFNPTRQNTDQWVETIKNTGAKSIIFTAKHHDGFCMWQTKTTDYSVKNSPYKNGKGDVVREVANSCKKYGMKFGVYLSPWDRNHKDYATPQYNDVYVEQLTELLTQYGDISYVWLDGACGSYMDGKEKQVYDFERYFALIRKLQPNALISNCGPDIRWVGNEGGFARESEWNVVPAFSFDLQTIERNSQQADDGEFAKRGSDIVASDLGSRDFLSGFENFIWYPAEVDVSIRPGWFYHKSQDLMVRSVSNLLNIYYNAVGGNSLLLLNIPPDRQGLINKADVKRLNEFSKRIKSAFKNKVKIKQLRANAFEKGCNISNVLNENIIEETKDKKNYYTPLDEQEKYIIIMDFKKRTNIDKVKLVEDTRFSQRIEKFSIFAFIDGVQTLVYNGTTVGFSRIALFKKPILADGIVITIDECRHKPYIEQISVFETDGKKLHEPMLKKAKIKVQQLNYQKFVDRENKKNKAL